MENQASKVLKILIPKAPRRIIARRPLLESEELHHEPVNLHVLEALHHVRGPGVRVGGVNGVPASRRVRDHLG